MHTNTNNDDATVAIEAVDLSKCFGGTTVFKSVSFTIRKGENVGIIGPNGAGKSTLFKILSGVLRPDSGSVILNGSVSSILEIGMGLHPDLTGFENIFFAGQLMGKSRKEIERGVSEIMEFSQLGEHMSKPVKHYSSGMYLRLAFSIYMQLETDILLLDEVLSVGDASFKRRSLDRMAEYRNRSKTVVLVSHNLNDIENFCDRVIYLDKEVKMDSFNIRNVILSYLSSYPNQPKLIDNSWIVVRPGQKIENSAPLVPQVNEYFSIDDLQLLKNGSSSSTEFLHSNEIVIKINYTKLLDRGRLTFIWKLFDLNDVMFMASSPLFDRKMRVAEMPRGKYEETTIIPGNFLNTGRYYLSVICGLDGHPISTYHSILAFTVVLDEWMLKERWSTIPSPIIKNFDWNRIRIE
ncbi:MAG: ATP-binding cassette domain-containing protein [Flavobacteriales bacterium]|nr:ATP-binding cassette domain-containing protein [Flavobacteriales bacterium]